VARAENVEISPAYEPLAGQLAAENGVAERISRRVADFAIDSDTVGGADAVIMHKVVCCYPDMPALVRPAAERARQCLVLTFPAKRWWIRAGLWSMNVVLALTRSRFRVFFHEPSGMLALAEQTGMWTALSQRGWLWHVVALERA
jgi:hypothetical protein